MFDQFREKIQLVQQDLNAGLKTLSEKAREVGRSKKLPGELHVLENKPGNLSALKPHTLDAGEEILNRFQQRWTEIHINIEACAEKAVKTDKVIQEVVERHEKQLQTWRILHMRIRDLPDMVTQIQGQAVALGKLEANFDEIETMLQSLENTCEEEELLSNKKTQIAELTRYKEQKSKERRLRRERLLDEYNQKFRRVEEKEDAKKKERQRTFQDVFKADMDHYRTHGQMSQPMAHSPRDQESSVDDFEVAVDDVDQRALDDFLGLDEEGEEDADDEDEDEEEDEEEEEEEKDNDEEMAKGKKEVQSTDGEDNEDDKNNKEEDPASSTMTTKEEKRDNITAVSSAPGQECQEVPKQDQASDSHPAKDQSVPNQQTDPEMQDSNSNNKESLAQGEKEAEQARSEGEEKENDEEDDFGTPEEDA